MQREFDKPLPALNFRSSLSFSPVGEGQFCLVKPPKGFFIKLNLGVAVASDIKFR